MQEVSSEMALFQVLEEGSKYIDKESSRNLRMSHALVNYLDKLITEYVKVET